MNSVEPCFRKTPSGGLPGAMTEGAAIPLSMKNEEMDNSGIEAAMAARYRIADGLAAVAMMVMIVVAAGLGTVILGG